MRPIPALLATLALAASFSSARAQKGAEVDFTLLDDGPQSSSMTEMVELSDGDLVCLGTRDLANGGTDLYAMRIHPDGRQVWYEQYSSPYASGWLSTRAVVRTPTDDLVILAAAGGGPSVSDFHLLRIDENGGLIRERTVDYYDWDSPVDLEVGPAGNVLVCGGSFDEERYILVKLDSEFQTLWTVVLGDNGATLQYPTDLEIAPNGDTLVAGIVDDGSDADVRLDRIAPDGTSVYSRDFGDPAEDDESPVLRIGSSGGTYLAFRKAAHTPAEDARLYRLNTSGDVQWGMVDPDLAWVKILELPNDEFLVGGVGPFAEGTNQTFRRFDASGSVLWTRTLDSVGFEHNWIRGLEVGDDGTFYSFAHATPEGVVGTKWLVNALTLDGGLVYQWSLDTEEGDYGFANALVPVGPGAVVIGGEIGDVYDDDSLVLRLEAVLHRNPRHVEVVEGRRRSGNLGSLEEVDGDRLEIATGDPGEVGSGDVVLEITAVLPEGYPVQQISASVTSRVSVPLATQWVDAYDFTTGTWERTQRTELSDTDSTVTLHGDTRLVDPVTRQIKLRVRCRQTEPVSSRAFLFSLDQVHFTIRP